MSVLKKIPVRYILYILVIAACVVYYKLNMPKDESKKTPEKKTIEAWPYKAPKNLVYEYLNDKTKWRPLAREFYMGSFTGNRPKGCKDLVFALMSLSEEFCDVLNNEGDAMCEEYVKGTLFEEDNELGKKKERQIIINVPELADEIVKNLLEVDCYSALTIWKKAGPSLESTETPASLKKKLASQLELEKGYLRLEWVKAVVKNLNEQPALVQDFINQYYTTTDTDTKRIIITMLGMTPHQEAFEFLKGVLQTAEDKETFKLAAHSICQDGRLKREDWFLTVDKIRPSPGESRVNMKLNKISEDRVELLIPYLYSKEYYKFHWSLALLSDYQHNHPKITEELLKIARHGAGLESDQGKIVDLRTQEIMDKEKVNEIQSRENWLEYLKHEFRPVELQKKDHALFYLGYYEDFHPEINKVAIEILNNEKDNHLREHAIELLRGEENNDYVLELKISVATTDPWPQTRENAIKSLSLDKKVFEKVFDRLVNIAASGEGSITVICKLNTYARCIKTKDNLHDPEVIDKVISALGSIGRTPSQIELASKLKQELIELKEYDKK